MDDNLVKTHPRDELLVKAAEVRGRQLREEGERALLKYGRKKIYEQAFCKCVKKYLKLDEKAVDIYLQDLSDAQIAELENLLYEMASKRLWLGWVWRIALGLSIPFFGWLALFLYADFGNNKMRDDRDLIMPMYPKYRFITLRDWYRKEFGQISFGSRSAARGEVVIPSLRD